MVEIYLEYYCWLLSGFASIIAAMFLPQKKESQIFGIWPQISHGLRLAMDKSFPKYGIWINA